MTTLPPDMPPESPPPERVMLPTLETPTLTKAELAELLFERLGLNKRESKDMVEAFFEIIHEALVSGRDVKLSGFGNFNIRRKAPRPGRNPRTGETVHVAEKRLPFFKVGKDLRERVNAGLGTPLPADKPDEPDDTDPDEPDMDDDDES